jgi:sugar/nucleoside kinase (ribokinase family)
VNRQHFGVLVVGSAVHDQSIYTGDLIKFFREGALAGKTNRLKTHSHPTGESNRAGGSAINTSYAIPHIAHALGMDTTVFKCMRLGRDDDNPGKKIILTELGNPKPGDRTLIDTMYRRDYRVPTNFVLENGSTYRDRLVIRGDKMELPLADSAYDDIHHAAAFSLFVVGNSSPLEETMIAFEAAKQYGGQTILDYSENGSPASIEAASKLIPYADYVVAPHDALLPGMTEVDPRELMRRLVYDFGRKHVAISNSTDPVLVHDNGREFPIKIYHTNVENTCGAGDTRNAALVVALARNHSFEQSVRIASDMSTYYISRPDRESFESSLRHHVAYNDLYRPPRHQSQSSSSRQQFDADGMSAAMAPA